LVIALKTTPVMGVRISSATLSQAQIDTADASGGALHSPRAVTQTFVDDPANLLTAVEHTFNDFDSTGREFTTEASANLADGTVRTRIEGSGGPAGFFVNSRILSIGATLYTLTFPGTYTGLPVSLRYEVNGSWDATAPLGLGPPYGQALVFSWLSVWDDSTVINDSDFGSFLDLLALIDDVGRPTIARDSDSVGPVLADPFPQVVNTELHTGVFLLSGEDPSIQVLGATDIAINSQDAFTTFDADYSQTASLVLQTPLDVVVETSLPGSSI
jgi:hypothetical protein